MLINAIARFRAPRQPETSVDAARRRHPSRPCTKDESLQRLRAIRQTHGV